MLWKGFSRFLSSPGLLPVFDLGFAVFPGVLLTGRVWYNSRRDTVCFIRKVVLCQLKRKDFLH